MGKKEKFETAIESVMEIFSNIALAKPEKLDNLLEKYALPRPIDKRPAPNKYVLKGLVGYKDHDITKVVLPAYTFPKSGRYTKKVKEPEDDCCVEEEKGKSRCGQKGFTFPRAAKPEEKIEKRLDVIYDIKTPTNCSKRYVWGRRTCGPRKENLPPNIYNLPDTKSGPHFKLKGLIKLPEPLATPGFLYPSIALTKPTSTGVIIGNSVKAPHLSITPSPADYRRECVYSNVRTSPKFTFGVRHSPRAIIPIM